MDFRGEFETHVTVGLATADDLARLRGCAAERGLKFTHIVLARGRTASQPMLTRHGRGELAEEMARAEALAEELGAAGFAVTRVKIEAAPRTAGVPQSDADAARARAGQYFELHVKLLLRADADLAALTALAEAHAAHLSRNALRVRGDGREERFVTQRCRGVGAPGARRRLDALRSALVAGGYAVLEEEAEYVVYDSDVSVDAGWIEAEGVST